MFQGWAVESMDKCGLHNKKPPKKQQTKQKLTHTKTRTKKTKKQEEWLLRKVFASNCYDLFFFSL